jgi:ABC-type multidrug transport system ATPase subunit
MIETFHLGAVVRGWTLWEGLDLAFDDGEAWIVTGPPSCGKTLLLRILCGDRAPDAGDVVAGGASLYRGPPGAKSRFRAQCGSVREPFSGGPDRTVADLFRLSAIAAGGIPRGERRRREEELLAMTGLAGTREVPLARLSVTERTRAALAAELLRGPKYLFLDMVLSNAGRDWTDTLMGLVRALAREGRTIVLAERAVPERLATPRAAEAGEGERGAGSPIRIAGPFVFSRLAGGNVPPGRPGPETAPAEPVPPAAGDGRAGERGGEPG